MVCQDTLISHRHAVDLVRIKGRKGGQGKEEGEGNGTGEGGVDEGDGGGVPAGW